MLTSDNAPVTAVEPHNERAIDLASVGVCRGTMGRELLACSVAGASWEEKEEEEQKQEAEAEALWTLNLVRRRNDGKPKLPSWVGR